MSKQTNVENLIKKANEIVKRNQFGDRDVSSTFLRNLMDNALKKNKPFLQAYIYYQMARFKKTERFCNDLLDSIKDMDISDIIELLSYIIWLAKYKERFNKNPQI
ncbi:MAG: hypothetical protein ACTSRP_18420 [Candidatus Helarchaeota archaeon]